jgi:beta-glucosidase
LTPQTGDQPPRDLIFPEGFLWGVSTSAHQVEGNNTKNQWHEWERQGRIKTGEACGFACGWWENAEADFDIAQKMGLNSLRLSVEWSRVEPRPGEWDANAFKRYRAMLKGLCERGIKPFVSLHHFTNPMWFEREGAFLNPSGVSHFERFAVRVVKEFGDLCSDWVTVNEPNVYAGMGYQLGEFPPGLRGKTLSAFKVLGNLCRAHARAYRAIHDLQPNANVGWAQHILAFTPGRPHSPVDRFLCYVHDELFNKSFIKMIATGKAPFPYNLVCGDLSSAKDTCDFVGVNVYNRAHVEFDLRWAKTLFSRIFIPPDLPQGDHGVEAPYGEAFPQCLAVAAQYVQGLKCPIYVLENGVPDRDDRIRPWLILEAVRELHQLVEQGFDVRGYFHWTLTDNFEWSEGWRLRFGLYHLNEVTLERWARPSAKLYSSIARHNGLLARHRSEASQLSQSESVVKSAGL